MLNDLIKVARRLDSFGLTKEANSLRAIIKLAGYKKDRQDLLGTDSEDVGYVSFSGSGLNDEDESNIHNDWEQSLLNREESYPMFTGTRRETRQNGEKATELLDSMSDEQIKKLLRDHPDAMWKMFGMRAKLH